MSHKILIKSEEDFFSNCPCTGLICSYKYKLENEDVRWFFKDCYANYQEQIFNVSFTSYVTPEYKDYWLCITAQKVNDIWEITHRMSP